MARPFRADRADVGHAHQRALDGRDTLVGDARRHRVDDQDRALHGVA
jgi:hypothetical protein